MAYLFDEFCRAIVHFLVFMGIYNDQLDSICQFALCLSATIVYSQF